MPRYIDDAFLDEKGVLNVTAVILLVTQLSPDNKSSLFAKYDVDDLSGFRDVLNTIRDEMYVRSYEEKLMQYTTYRCHKVLMLYVPPILLAIGTAGNLLTFAILMLRSMRGLSTYMYLAVLALTDTLVLYSGLLRLWVGEVTGHGAEDHAAWTCKLFNAVGYTVSDYSVWLIIAVTFERYVAVCRPLHAHAICRRSRAAPLMCCIFVILAAINAHFFWTTDIRGFKYNDELIQQCDGAVGYEKLVRHVWPWVDAAIYSFFPFVVLSVFNGLIIHKVISARRKRSAMSCRGKSSAAMMSSAGSGGGGAAGVGAGGGAHSDSSARLTAMLLTVSFAFLVTTLPMNVTLIVAAFWNNSDNILLSSASAFKLAHTVTSLLMYTNHSMNFFLYCATGHKFRQQLCRLFFWRSAWKRRRGDDGAPPATDYTTVNSLNRSIISRIGVRGNGNGNGTTTSVRKNDYELVKM